MGASHSAGLSQGIRQGCDSVDHSFRVTANSAIQNKKLLRVSASVSKPTLLVVREVGGTVVLAGSPTYALGTASGGAQIVASKAFPAINTPVAAVAQVAGGIVFTADFDIWLTTNAGTAGVAWLLFTLIELNVADVNANSIP